jgi:hypothetical protein
LTGRAQVFDEAWKRRLGITRPDLGIGMTSPEVTELSLHIDVGALRKYRDAVGLRTREAIGSFEPGSWDGQVAVEAVQRAAAQGAFGVRTEQIVKIFPGRPRKTLLSGIALFHSMGHMGEAVTVRAAGGFGSQRRRRLKALRNTQSATSRPCMMPSVLSKAQWMPR